MGGGVLTGCKGLGKRGEQRSKQSRGRFDGRRRGRRSTRREARVHRRRWRESKIASQQTREMAQHGNKSVWSDRRRTTAGGGGKVVRGVRPSGRRGGVAHASYSSVGSRSSLFCTASHPKKHTVHAHWLYYGRDACIASIPSISEKNPRHNAAVKYIQKS